MENSVFGNIDTDNLTGLHSIYLGCGEMACYYKVNRFGKWFFMKKLKPEYAHDIRIRLALRKEIETGLAISHPNIVAYHNYVEDAEGDCVLMEMVDGLTLEKFAAANPDYFRNKNHRRRFVEEMLSAVSCIHRHGILHLDLKPDNILITSGGRHVKIADLGMAYTDSFTYTYGGTQGYSAPELFTADGAVPSEACDVFSMGRILQFIGWKDRRLIRRCICDNPAERYQSVEEIQLAINRHRTICRMAASFLPAAALIGVIGIGAVLYQQAYPDIAGVPHYVNGTDSVVAENTKSPNRERVANKEKENVFYVKDSVINANANTAEPARHDMLTPEIRLKMRDFICKNADEAKSKAKCNIIEYDHDVFSSEEEKRESMQRYAAALNENRRIVARLDSLLRSPDDDIFTWYVKFRNKLNACQVSMYKVAGSSELPGFVSPAQYVQLMNFGNVYSMAAGRVVLKTRDYGLNTAWLTSGEYLSCLKDIHD